MQKPKSLTELDREGYEAVVSSERYKEVTDELMGLLSDLRKQNPNASKEQIFRMWRDLVQHNDEYLVAISTFTFRDVLKRHFAS